MLTLNARDLPGCSRRLARCVAMWCDAQRRVVERCDAPKRAALPTVMSISLRVSSTNLMWLVAGRLQGSAADVVALSFDRAEKAATAGMGCNKTSNRSVLALTTTILARMVPLSHGTRRKCDMLSGKQRAT